MCSVTTMVALTKTLCVHSIFQDYLIDLHYVAKCLSHTFQVKILNSPYSLG